jgi:hypothetical protein
MTEIQDTRVVDIEMRFGSMVMFMVKWAFAAIPALMLITMILIAAGMILMFALAALGQAVSVPQVIR